MFKVILDSVLGKYVLNIAGFRDRERISVILGGL